MKTIIDEFLKNNNLKVNEKHPEAKVWIATVDPSSMTFLDELAKALGKNWLIDEDETTEQNEYISEQVKEIKNEKTKRKFSFNFKQQFALTFAIFIYILSMICAGAL